MNNTIHKSNDGLNIDLIRIKEVTDGCGGCYYLKIRQQGRYNCPAFVDKRKTCIQTCFGKEYFFIFIKAF